MGFCYAPPNNSHISPADFLFRFVHVGHPLAKVELGVLLRGDTFELKEGGIGMGVTFPPLVPKDAALRVKSSGGHWWKGDETRRRESEKLQTAKALRLT